MSIADLATDPDVEPLWAGILRGELDGSPGQIAAFAEACSFHGLDGLEVGEIVAQLRQHRLEVRANALGLTTKPWTFPSREGKPCRLPPGLKAATKEEKDQ